MLGEGLVHALQHRRQDKQSKTALENGVEPDQGADRPDHGAKHEPGPASNLLHQHGGRYGRSRGADNERRYRQCRPGFRWRDLNADEARGGKHDHRGRAIERLAERQHQGIAPSACVIECKGDVSCAHKDFPLRRRCDTKRNEQQCRPNNSAMTTKLRIHPAGAGAPVCSERHSGAWAPARRRRRARHRDIH